ncbi:monocarboxylate transporter 14-like [Amyelois transitella]|uniref:monocarboxylate transporter 14 n=1 Tax=Amyelois transitella TaxID=680683 RepID=UPI00067C7AED|nr:monocarboxylate transporter 14 [Amyelois transitella]XP_060802974.1 monocarboxylate transporter 14-like [Amyelois transitella]
MDTERVYSNGVPGKEKTIKYEHKVPSEEEKTTSPLLNKINDFKYIDEKDDKLERDVKDEKPKEDLNKVNSMKTDSHSPKNSLAVGYKNEKHDDDATSNNEGVKFFGLGEVDSICSSKPPEQPPQIPDGGWGWVVVAASFLIATVADGLAFSYGLMHDKFVDHFGQSEAKTSVIGSLFISVPLIAGPIMSALVDRYGCRNMTILGGVASTIGFVAASLSNSVEVLYVTYGLMAGIGMGLLYVTAVVSIAYWFEKRRNLAVGLGSCGVGFGTFVYSPLTTYLLEEYGWRGALLLLAGTVLNVCICGAVMRDPEWLILEQKKQRKLNHAKKASSSVSISARSARSGGTDSVYPGIEELKTLMKSGETPEYILTTLVASIAEAENLEATTKQNTDLSHHKVSSVVNLPTFLRQSERLPVEVLEQLSANKRLYNIVLQNYPSLLALRSNSEQKLPIEPAPEAAKSKPVTMSMKLKLKKKQKKDFETKLEKVREKLLQPIPENKTPVIPPRQDWLSRQLNTDHHYLRDIRVHRNSIMHRGAMMNIAKYKLRASSCPDIYRNSMWSVEDDQEEKTCLRRMLDTIKKTFDFNMFTEFHFLMMNLSTLVLFIWFIVPYFYIANFMEKSGYPASDGSWMLSVFGVANIIGIVGLGWIGDLPWVNITKTYALCLVICGGNIVLFPLLIGWLDPHHPASFYAIACNAVMFGLMFSSSYSYTPSILVELIALERFTMAYGLVLLSQGVGHLVGPPMAGALKDITGYWDAAFYVAGVWVIISGLLVAVIPYTKNFRMCGNAPLAKDAAGEPDPNIKIIIAH